MVSTRDMRDLLAYANRTNVARVVLLGDVQQLDAVAAGTPFNALQRAGMPTAVMDDIVRQRDAPELLEGVHHAIRGEIAEAFEKIGARVSEGDLARTAAERYMALSPKERADTALITLSNQFRKKTNEHVRAARIAAGEISANGVTISSLAPLHLTRAEAGDARSYKPGDILIASATNAKAGLTKTQTYTIVATNQDRRTVTLEAWDGSQRTHRLSQASPLSRSTQAFTRETVEASVGDLVRFTLTDKTTGITNGERGRVTGISESHVRVQIEGGKELRFETDSLAARGMNLAYAVTAHAVQGDTKERAIAVLPHRSPLSHQKAFYVAISRAERSAELITDNIEKLAEKLKEQTGMRFDALDVLGRTAQRGGPELAGL